MHEEITTKDVLVLLEEIKELLKNQDLPKIYTVSDVAKILKMNENSARWFI